MADAIQSLNQLHLQTLLQSAEGIHELFGLLGYTVPEPEPIEPEALDLNDADAPHVQRVYIVNDGTRFGHTIWLYEVSDLRMVRLRGLANDALTRGGTHLLILTTD